MRRRSSPAHGGEMCGAVVGRRADARSARLDRVNFCAPAGGRRRADTGNAQVEFLGVALVLILPVLYLALTLGRIQAATFAVEGAAKESARAFVTADSVAEGQARAEVATSLALSDQGFEDVLPADVLELACSTDPCLAPGSEVVTVVRYDVALPFVPAGIRSWVPLSVPVQAVHTSPVDRYAGDRS